MSFWSLLTFVCDFFKLQQLASYWWKKHEIYESQVAQAGINRMDDGYVLKRLRQQYSRD